MNKITLYSKPDCPLCDKAENVLRKLQRRFRYEIEVVDITQDEALLERYCFEIPVVVLDGVECFRGRVNEGELRAALRKAV
jgi:glutaredoxin